MPDSPRLTTRGPLRIALLVYRGNPHSGGQGVYVRHLSKQLVALGHHVEVFSGQPYPELVPEVPLVKVPSLDLYRPDNPFRVPHLREFRSPIDVAEFALDVHGRLPRAAAPSACACASCCATAGTTSTSSTTTSASPTASWA